MISYENTKANKQTKTLKSSTLLMTSQLWWASLVVQAVRNPPATWKTWVRSLGWEDPLEEGMAIDSSIFAWTIPKNRGDLEVYSPWSHTELDMTAATQLQSGLTDFFFQISNILFSYSYTMKFPKDLTT